MRNISLIVKNNTLTITIDLKKDFGKSKKGNSNVVACTDGWAVIPEHEGMALNLFVSKK